MTPTPGSVWKTAAGTLALAGFALAGSIAADREIAHACSTSIEENKATARRWTEELWGKGDLTVADAIIAADYRRHDPGDPFPARGPEDVKRIVRAGDVARYAAFVAGGCLRSDVIDPRGREHIVKFAPENWWVGDSTSLSSGAPSRYFIDAIEESEVLLIDAPSHERVLTRVPAYAAAFSIGLQRHAAANDRRIVSALTSSAEERYLEFLKTYPTIARRVPQTMLASYLGMTPETISRIRKKRSRRSRSRLSELAAPQLSVHLERLS